MTLYRDFRRELVWGALSVVNGAVYLGTGSYCDRFVEGKVLRVDLATRALVDRGDVLRDAALAAHLLVVVAAGVARRPRWHALARSSAAAPVARIGSE